jgi:hypothetical protein
MYRTTKRLTHLQSLPAVGVSACRRLPTHPSHASARQSDRGEEQGYPPSAARRAQSVQCGSDLTVGGEVLLEGVRLLSLCWPHFHIVQRRAMSQPRDLPIVIRMYQLRLPPRTARFPHLQSQVHARLEVVSTQNVQLVFDLDIVIGRRVGERKREHPLFLEVGLVDARKAARYNGHSAEKSGLQRGVLAAGAFAVVPVAEDAPSDACGSVSLCDSGHHVDVLCGEVESLSAKCPRADGGFCAGEEVVGDVF